MDLVKVLAQLHAELENLEAAIVSLERLQQEGRRRGRPPKLLAEIKKATRTSGRKGTKRGRFTASPASGRPGGR